MAFIGVNIREVDGAGAPAVVGAPTSVAAFNILTRRGVPNRPLRIDSFPKFVENFGSYFAGGLGAYLVKGFFDNSGLIAYVNRVVSTDPTTGHAAATRTFQDGAAVDTLMVSAGFRGQSDPGSWGDDLHVRIAAAATASSRLRQAQPPSITGTVALAAPVDMSTLPSLTLRIDGQTTDTEITFAASDFPGGATAATPQQIRDAINARQSNVVASLDASDNLVLTSTGAIATLNDGWSSLEVRAANATLGFTAGPPVFGTPAAISGTSATLRRSDAFAIGDAIRLGDGTNSAPAKLLARNPDTGAITWTPAIGTIGTWTARDITVTNLRFDLTVAYGGSEPEDVVEEWPALSMEADIADYVEARINDPVRGSKYVIVDDELSTSAAGQDLPAATTGFVRLNPGREGVPTSANFSGDQAQRTGFFAFDPFAVQLICCERTDQAITTAALAYCAGRGDCVFIGAVPHGFIEAGQALAYGQLFRASKVFGALYGPWIKVADPVGVGDNPTKIIPPVGHVIGTFARIEGNRGVWKAPAGDEANLRGVLDVTYNLTDAEHTDLVKNGSINGIRAVPRAGIVIDASRTLSTDTRWLYVNVRLLFNFVKSSLRDGLRWVRQEPNRDFLWTTVKFSSVTPFLLGLWRQGAFGTGTPEEVFTVIVDATNNPPEQVEQGILNIEVYFYPSRPAETIIITVGQQPSGGFASEA